jgi:hypothetical protein
VAGRIGTGDYIFYRDPLEYRLNSANLRLVMRIYNPTEESITLLGGHSAVVDPRGQSHPLVTQTMVPGSFIRLVLPPQRPRVYRGGPTFGVGVGTRIGSARGGRGAHGVGAGVGIGHGPRYMAVYDDGQPIYWDWTGGSDIRLILAFAGTHPAAQPFTHEFVLRRVRAR